MTKCKTCGAPVTLAPDGDPKYVAPTEAVTRLTAAGVDGKLQRARELRHAFFGGWKAACGDLPDNPLDAWVEYEPLSAAPPAPTDAKPVEARAVSKCPHCGLNWMLSLPANIHGGNLVRCVECKGVFPIASTPAPAQPVEDAELVRLLRQTAWCNCSLGATVIDSTRHSHHCPFWIHHEAASAIERLTPPAPAPVAMADAAEAEQWLLSAVRLARAPMTEERIDRVAEAMANEARKRHGLDHMWLELMPNKADWRSRARAAIAVLAADAEARGTGE